MIQKLSILCARKMLPFCKPQAQKEAVLIFGCELIITTIISLLILIGLSFLIGHPLAWLFFTIGFAPHRTSAGGYHADTHLRCNIVTLLMLLLSIVASYCFTWNAYLYIVISLFSAVLILLLAPVTASNKPLSVRRYRRNRMRAIIVTCINCCVAVILTMLEMVCEETNLYFSGIFFAATSLIMGKIKTNKKGEQTNENKINVHHH